MDSELQALQILINRFKDFPVFERKPSFLEIAGFPSRETVWRNIFAFFFDPNECHGFKDLFLRSFFDALGKPEQGTGDFGSMTVSMECQTPKGNYLDLLIRCHDFAIGIEMKVNAALYNDLVDYGKLVAAKNPDGRAYKVVLSNAPCQTYAGFVNLRYADLVPAIKQQLGNYVLSADPKYTSLLLDFLNHVTSYIGGYAMDIDPKLLTFMKDNHNNVQRLFNTHNDLHRLLESKMAQIHDEIMRLASLNGIIGSVWRLHSYQGRIVCQFLINASAIRFRSELAITDDYCIKTCHWIDHNQKEYQHLDHELKTAGFVAQTFDLSQPVEEVVAAIEKTILALADYLKKKQPPATAQ